MDKIKTLSDNDSVSVKKKDSSSTSNGQWTREIINYPYPLPDNKRPDVNNYHYPVQVIRETGNYSKTDVLNTIDSMRNAEKKDESISKVDERLKKETKVLTPLQLIALSVGASFVFVVLSKFIKFNNPLNKINGNS